jgi:hypothetical protein
VRQGQLGPGLVHLLEVRGDKAGAQVPACAARAAEGLERLARAGNVPVVEKRRCEGEREAPSVGAGPFQERAVERDGRRGEAEGLRACRGDQRERHLAR